MEKVVTMCCYYNPGQILKKIEKIEKSSKTGQYKKSLISTFACFFDCYCQSLFLEERLDTRLSPPKFEIFLIFSYFQRS